jgi:hypothetical protein
MRPIETCRSASFLLVFTFAFRSSGLRSPVSGLRSPVSGLRSPVSGLRSPVSGLRLTASVSPINHEGTKGTKKGGGRSEDGGRRTEVGVGNGVRSRLLIIGRRWRLAPAALQMGDGRWELGFMQRGRAFGAASQEPASRTHDPIFHLPSPISQLGPIFHRPGSIFHSGLSPVFHPCFARSVAWPLQIHERRLAWRTVRPMTSSPSYLTITSSSVK